MTPTWRSISRPATTAYAPIARSPTCAIRHTDSDFVRVARQSDFIRQAKEQLGVGALIGKYNQILGAFGKAIHTDIHTYDATYQLLQLAAYSLSAPVRHVEFQTNNDSFFYNGGDYVTSTPALIKASIYDFLNESPRAAAPPGTPAGHGHHHHHAPLLSAASLAALDLYRSRRARIPDAERMSVDVPFKVYLPTIETGSAGFAADFTPTLSSTSRGTCTTAIASIGRSTATAATTASRAQLDQSAAVRQPTATETINGRRYMFVGNGGSYQYIGWREGKVLYWVSNTLLDDLTNRQMLALAESAHPIP